jgi:hypothetical protein
MLTMFDNNSSSWTAGPDFVFAHNSEQTMHYVSTMRGYVRQSKQPSQLCEQKTPKTRPQVQTYIMYRTSNIETSNSIITLSDKLFMYVYRHNSSLWPFVYFSKTM